MAKVVDWKEVHRFAYATEPRIVAEAVERGFKVALPQGVPDGDDMYFRYPDCQWISVQCKSTSALTRNGYSTVGLISSRGGKTTGKYRGTVGLSGADFYIVRCRGKEGFYILPRDILPASGCLRLSPRYDQYLNAWDLLKVRKETNEPSHKQLATNPAPHRGSDSLVLQGQERDPKKSARSKQNKRTTERNGRKGRRSKEGSK